MSVKVLKKKQYLGDGLYVTVNKSAQLVLTAEDGISVTNTIYLESDTWQNLKHFVDSLKEEVEK